MTRCYEGYCFFLDHKEACPKDDRLWRYINAYIRLMQEKGVEFDRQPHDKARFYALRKKYGTEYAVTQRKELSAIPLPNGKFYTIVIDPPWPMKKILRIARVRQQLELDYPNMTVDEIKTLPLRSIAAENCHVYLWTTQKFLPTAFEVFKAWGVKYECLLTWVKNVGFTPFSWMYSTEHVLFGRLGSLELLQKGKRLDFEGKVREHSRKPDSFYDLVREVSPAPRIDVFSREKRDGFEQYGNEVEKFNDL